MSGELISLTNIQSPINNIFGSMANLMPGANVGFIPLDDKGTTLDVSCNPMWQNLQTKQMQYWAYLFCSPLASVIDRETNADLNGVIEVLKDDGDYDTSRYGKSVKKRMQNPNPMQDWYEFRGEQMVYKKTYGYTLVYKMEKASEIDRTTTLFWNLDPLFCQPIMNESFSLVKSPNRIKEGTVQVEGTAINVVIPAEKIIILRDGYMPARGEFGFPLSKIAGLEWAISNIMAAMEADNVLLRKKGPLGFISQDSAKDPVAGYVPLNPKEKKEIQDDLAQYGLSWSQWQFMVTRHGLRWNPMSFNVKDLATKETIRQGIDSICDRYGYPAELMSGKNATYENRTSSERWLLNNITIPESNRDMLKFTTYFETNVSACFDDLSVLQDAVLANGQGPTTVPRALDLQYKSALITKNQYLQELEYDKVPDGDVYYEAPVALAPVAPPKPMA